MIRTPEAKRQAELLMTELSLQGLTLQRGKALDIIAKLQGYKGWNELAAAAAKAAAVESPLAVPGSPLCYLVPGMPETAGLELVDCSRLAAFLKHEGRDTTTTLLNYTAPLGGVYRLQLSGRVRYEYVAADGSPVAICSRDGLEAFDAAMQNAPDEGTIIDKPFFEWVDAAGDSVGQVFDELPAEPVREIQVLLQLLHQWTPPDDVIEQGVPG